MKKLVEEILYMYNDDNKLIKKMIKHDDIIVYEFIYEYINEYERINTLRSFSGNVSIIEKFDENNNIIMAKTDNMIETYQYKYENNKIIEEIFRINDDILDICIYAYDNNGNLICKDVYDKDRIWNFTIEHSYIDDNVIIDSITTSKGENNKLVSKTSPDGKFKELTDFKNKIYKTYIYDDNKNLINESLYYTGKSVLEV